ncbi:MAG: hypothetical protein WA210_02895 [Burkholderiaceae bacterium]
MYTRPVVSGVSIASVLAGVALAGCAQMSSAPMVVAVANPCAGDELNVMVSVTSACTISIDKPDLVMPQGKKNIRIRWILDASSSQQFKFPRADGILLKDPGDHDDEQFRERRTEGNDRRYHWCNKNSKIRRYEYQITVMKDDGTRCTPLDPWISNR